MAITTPLYLTKYALTKGIMKVRDEDLDERYKNTSDTAIKLKGFLDYFHIGKDIFRSHEEAKKVAEQMRDKKIESVKKQLKKLEKMTF